MQTKEFFYAISVWVLFALLFAEPFAKVLRGFLTSVSSDINECLADSHDCSAEQVCINTDGSFRCQLSCHPGFTITDGVICKGKEPRKKTRKLRLHGRMKT